MAVPDHEHDRPPSRSQYPYAHPYHFPHPYGPPYQQPGQPQHPYAGPHWPTDRPNPPAHTPSSSTGNIAQPYSVQVPGGIHDSGTRDYRKSTTVGGHQLNLHLSFPENGPTPADGPPLGPDPGLRDWPPNPKVGDHGPIGLLHEVTSLVSPAHSSQQSSSIPVQTPKQTRETWKHTVSPDQGSPSLPLPSQASPSLPLPPQGSSSPSVGNFVRTSLERSKRKIQSIRMSQNAIARVLESYRRFIPDIWAQIQGQIATVKIQELVFRDETEYWRGHASDSMPDDLPQLLNALHSSLGIVKESLIVFRQKLDKVVEQVGPHKLHSLLKRHQKLASRTRRRAGTDNVKQQLDSFRDELRVISDTISQLERKFEELTEMGRPIAASSEGASSDDDEDSDDDQVVLQSFRMIRHASASLYQQLGQVCPVHPEHHFYFHLELEEIERLEAQGVKFHISIERKNITDHGGPDRIWFCARAVVRNDETDDPSQSSYTARSSPIPSPYPKSDSGFLQPAMSPRMPIRRNYKSDFGTSRPYYSQRAHPYRRNRSVTSSMKDPAQHVRLATDFKGHGRGGEGGSRSRNSSFKSLPSSQSSLKPLPLPTGTSCLESLSQGTNRWAADLPRRHERGEASCELEFPSRDTLEAWDAQPIRLLDWIRTQRDSQSDTKRVSSTGLQLICIRLAKRIVRSVLGLSPNIWPQHRPLQTNDILILERAQGWLLDPLLDVHLVKTRMPNNGSPLQHESLGLAAGRQSHPAIILHLSIILLELAYLQEMPQLRETSSGDVNRDHDSFHEMRRRCDLRKVFGGDAYAKAVKHCFDFNGSSEDFFSSEYHQRKFYREVVMGLEKAEKSADEAWRLQEGC